MQFADLDDELECLDAFELNERGIIINLQEDHNQPMQFKSAIPQCEDWVLPPIDLSQNTLIDKYAQGSGCKIDFEKKLFSDDSSNKVQYVIEAKAEGACEKLGASMNLILMPKIPEDYSIGVKVE